MELTQEQKLIYKAQICPYCKGKTKLYKDSSVVYGKDYGPVWACLDCKAWCGCHPGTHKPLGRLASKRLRELKIQAHFWFDKIYTYKIKKRGAAYQWLSEQLGIPKRYTHIGMFSEATCYKVVKICRNFINEHYQNKNEKQVKNV